MESTALDAHGASSRATIDPKATSRTRGILESRHQEGLVPTISSAGGAKFRVLVAGRLQAGKTTLVNTLCGTVLEPGKEDIETGIPHPSLLLHDSAGFEGAGGSRMRLVKTFLAKRGLARTFPERVHAIWYCICTDTGMQLSPGDLHFFDNDIAQKVPVIAVFTRYRGLVTRAFADLRITLKRVEAKEKRFEKARELLQLQYIDPLKALRYPPTAFIQVDDLLDETTNLEHLVHRTLELMTEDRLRPTVSSVRQINLDYCMESAVSEYDLSTLKKAQISRFVLCDIIRTSGKLVYDLGLVTDSEMATRTKLTSRQAPVESAPAITDLNDEHLAPAIAACQSGLSRKFAITSAHTKRAEVIATLCICIEQTSSEGSASMDDFPGAFSQAVDAYFAPNSVVRASVNKEIAKLSPYDYRETQDPTSDCPSQRPATAKLIQIIKAHRLRLTIAAEEPQV
ncbi:hypothetical protein MIND_00921000 [Mycena indigotica]|uniref:G domain-containing protein n=1 Tax=Mycena indigotica TaxID=2126181 RepID=A0A8H6SEJ3_9AGAR|nr:uncharacterized protein MIND_00921000 [Mycena indigotica]KAF7296892.1 hypothetical protein MIND_00921000 [Mycena indigotica]